MELTIPTAQVTICLFNTPSPDVLSLQSVPMPAVQSDVGRHAATTVLVADVTRMDCQLLANAMHRHNGFRVVGCVTTSEEASSAIYRSQPDLALISIRLQDGALAGLNLLPGVRGLQPRLQVIMLLDENSPEVIVEAFRNGARGVFCRTGSFPELRKCMECIQKGQIWASNPQVECVVQALMRAPTTSVTRPEVTTVLSKREEEVARLVASGFSNREVSIKLSLSKHTVKNYLFRIFEKLGFSTRIELVLYMLSQAKRPEAEHNCESPDATQKLRA